MSVIVVTDVAVLDEVERIQAQFRAQQISLLYNLHRDPLSRVRLVAGIGMYGSHCLYQIQSSQTFFGANCTTWLLARLISSHV